MVIKTHTVTFTLTLSSTVTNVEETGFNRRRMAKTRLQYNMETDSNIPKQT